MTNLTEIFELGSDYAVPNDFLSDTRDFFCREKSRCALPEMVEGLNRIRDWFDMANTTGTINISHPGLDMEFNYLYLMETINNGCVRSLYLEVKEIRAEMKAMLSKDNLDEYKRLDDFWEVLETTFKLMSRNSSN